MSWMRQLRAYKIGTDGALVGHLYSSRVAKLADAGAKSPWAQARAGSNPAPGASRAEPVLGGRGTFCTPCAGVGGPACCDVRGCRPHFGPGEVK